MADYTKELRFNSEDGYLAIWYNGENVCIDAGVIGQEFESNFIALSKEDFLDLTLFIQKQIGVMPNHILTIEGA